jgi:hypothetical protein
MFEDRHETQWHDLWRVLERVLEMPFHRVDERLSRIEAQNRVLLSIVRKMQKQETTMATDLTALTAAVAADTDVDNSAIILLNQLSQMLKDAATDPQAIADIAAALDANSAALAAAVVANTPAAPPEPVPEA